MMQSPLLPALGKSQPALSAVSLDRGLTTGSAIALNIVDMVGVGPSVTLPLIVIAMGGPQAALGWLMGAALSMCDGLIWSELGATYPEAGGSYADLKRLYGERGTGRPLSFLYAWQLLFAAPLSIASGCIGFSLYASYFLPASLMQRTLSVSPLHFPLVLDTPMVRKQSSRRSSAMTIRSTYLQAFCAKNPSWLTI